MVYYTMYSDVLVLLAYTGPILCKNVHNIPKKSNFWYEKITVYLLIYGGCPLCMKTHIEYAYTGNIQPFQNLPEYMKLKIESTTSFASLNIRKFGYLLQLHMVR